MKTMLWDAVKEDWDVDLKQNTYPVKLERSQINHLTVYFKELEK